MKTKLPTKNTIICTELYENKHELHNCCKAKFNDPECDVYNDKWCIDPQHLNYNSCEWLDSKWTFWDFKVINKFAIFSFYFSLPNGIT